MSRIAKKPLVIPKGVEFKQKNDVINIKGSKGNFEYNVHSAIDVTIDGSNVMVALKEGMDSFKPMVGTTRVLLANMVKGVEQGFKKILHIKGVGYRAKVVGKNLELTLGFSHPISYSIPDDISIDTPSNTEVIVSGINKERVGKVSAEIRAFRPVENYKGKGVRYVDEEVSLKETKKK